MGKKITIVELDNGFVVNIERESLQSMFVTETQKIANNVDEVVEIIKDVYSDD